MANLLLLSVGGVLLFLLALRLWDWRAEQVEWARLAALQPMDPPRFEPGMTAGLPGPAQRFFNHSIAPGTALLRVAEIDMGGWFRLGSVSKPAAYGKMHARQILAAPWGFVWRLRLRGGVPVSGSDSGGWTRFRVLGLLPVARLGGDEDHSRSAFGRYVAEAVFWTPAALLPGEGVAWQEVNDRTARVTVEHLGMTQSVDVEVAEEGRPLEVRFMRWSNANPDKVHRLQPFGGTLSDFREVAGYRLPFRVEAGHGFGTADYYPFFDAEVTDIRFPNHRE